MVLLVSLLNIVQVHYNGLRSSSTYDNSERNFDDNSIDISIKNSLAAHLTFESLRGLGAVLHASQSGDI